MGYYINPVGKSKEQWLKDNGRQIKHWSHTEVGEYPVCLVDNGMFTAAGIAYDEGEAMAFANPDGRPKEWWAVTKEKLIEVQPGVAVKLQ